MADATMASVPVVGAAVGGLPTGGGLEALKYASQADMFQDDPNFYTWLEDWIGKADEESLMIDAFNTLTDYGLQFDFQQHQRVQQQGPEPGAGLTWGTSPLPTGGSGSDLGASFTQQQQHAQLEHLEGAASSRAPHPSSNNASLAALAASSTSGSSFAVPSCDPQRLAAGTFSPSPFLRPAPAAAPQFTTAATTPGPAAAVSASAAGPFDAASFSTPLSRGLDAAQVLPLELSRLLVQPPSSSLPGAPSSSSRPSEAVLIPSHGTVTSCTGTPPAAAVRADAGNLTAAAGVGSTAAAAAPSLSACGPGVGITGGLGSPGLLNVPSLEQLIVWAICGNGVGGAVGGSSAAAAGRGGGRDNGGGGSLGLAVLGGGRCEFASTGDGRGSVPVLTSTFVRHSSSGGSGLDAAAVAGDSAMRCVDEDAPSGRSACANDPDLLALLLNHHHQQPQFPSQPYLSAVLSASASSAGTAGSSGGGGGSSRHHGLSHSSVYSNLSWLHLPSGRGHGSSSHHRHHNHHHHHRGIPVAHGNTRATHVSKAMAAGGGGGGVRGYGGVSASGKPTRNARAKAVFAALEAEVAGKLSELEALTQENATLTQRVEILEVAVERQRVVLSLMSAANAAAAAVDGSSGDGGGGVSPELLEWARSCTVETYVVWYKEHLQDLSLALLALEDSVPNPGAEMRLVQLVVSCWVRTALVSIFQPLTQLRLRGLNLETETYDDPSELHWMEVIRFMTVTPQQVAEMETLFHSYNLLHGSFRSELQDTQRELAVLVEAQDRSCGGRTLAGEKTCSSRGLEAVMQQMALLKRVRSILQKTHLLYSCTIGVAALRILKPKEFAKCAVHSYPYYPCGPSLMKACYQLRALKAMWGVDVGPCRC